MNTGDLGINGERLAQRIRNLPFPHLTCVDVGVRDGTSSAIMLEATKDRQAHIIGIDASPIPYTLKTNPRYEAIEHTDSVTALSELREPIHVAWLDTLHCAHQAAAEAYFLWPLMPVGGLLCFHDTAWPEGKRDCYCGIEWPTIDKAVMWLFSGREYGTVEGFPDSWGTMFVTKTKDVPLESQVSWRDIFAGRNMLLSIMPDSVRREVIWK